MSVRTVTLNEKNETGVTATVIPKIEFINGAVIPIAN